VYRKQGFLVRRVNPIKVIEKVLSFPKSSCKIIRKLFNLILSKYYRKIFMEVFYMKKVIGPGIVAGVGMVVVGWLVSLVFGKIFPSLAIEYQNIAIFRPWSDPLMYLYILAPFVLGIALAIVWDKVKTHLSGSAFKTGISFGLFYWLVSLSGMIISYGSFKISLLMTISWTVTGLFQALVAGLIIVSMNSK